MSEQKQYVKWLKFEIQQYEKDEKSGEIGPCSKLMLKTLRIALESVEAEPVAYMTYKGYLIHAGDPKLKEYSEPTPLYDAPPARD